MISKAVLAAALLCLAQGQYIFNDPISVVQKLQPQVDQLLKNVENQINEVDNSIQSTSKYVDLKIEDANNAVAEKLKLLQKETSEGQKLDKNIDSCVQNHVMAIQSSNVAVLNTIKEEANWAIYDKQFAELKSLVVQVKVIASNCIGQSKMDSNKLKVCMEERIAAIEKQSTKISGYVVSSMSMIKESLAKAIQVRVLNIFDVISQISSEFNACVEQSPTLTIESVIDSKKAEINALKESIQLASDEWTNQIAGAYKNINGKVKAVDVSINAQITSLKIVGGDMTLNSCISKHAEGLNNLDKSELEKCRSQSDILNASNELIGLPNLKALIGAAPGSCVEKVGVSPKEVQKCIEEAIASTQKQFDAITTSATTHYVNGMRSGVTCVMDAEATIKNKINEVISQFTSCVKENSAAVDEAVNEYRTQMDTLNTNIRSTVEELGLEIEESYKLIKNAVDAARQSVNNQLTSLSSIKIGEESAECVTEQENDVKRLDKKALERCLISSALENANKVVVEIAAYEGIVEETPSICRTEVGENVEKVKQCIADKLNRIHVDIHQLVTGLNSSVSKASESQVQCAQYAHSELISGLKRIISTFNVCVATKSAIFKEAISEFKDKMDTMKTNVRNTVEEWTVEIANTYMEIKSAVDTARSSVNNKITSLSGVAVPKEANECVEEQENRVSRLDKKSLERCQISTALESANMVVVEIANYEVVIEETPLICMTEEDVKQCIVDKLHLIHVDINQFVTGLKSSVSKAKENQLQCSEYTSSKLMSDLEAIFSTFNVCIKESSLTVEEVIDSLKDDLKNLQTSTRSAINQWNDQIATGFNQLQKIILEASESVNGELSHLKLKLQEENELTTSCIQQEKTLINNLDQSELHSCGRTASLNSASEHIAQLARIEANIGGLVGICVQGNTVRQFKQCMENGINEGNLVLNNLIEETRVVYVNGMQTGSSCVINNKQHLLSQIEEINTRYSSCVEENSLTVEAITNALKSEMDSLKLSIKQNVNTWSEQISSGNDNLKRMVSEAIKNVNRQVSELSSKLSDSDETTKACLNELLKVKQLDQTDMLNCAKSTDLDIATKQMVELAKIEAKIDEIAESCVAKEGQTGKMLKQCIVGRLEQAQFATKDLTEGIKLAYVNGMKKGNACISSTTEVLVNQIEEINSSFEQCLEENSLTVKEVLEILNKEIENLKSSVDDTVAKWNNEISASYQNLQKLTQDAVVQINYKLNFKKEGDISCNEQRENSNNNLDQSSLTGCGTNAFTDAVQKSGQIASIGSSAKVLPGICVGKVGLNDAKSLKVCIENGIEEAQSTLKNLNEEIRVAYVNGLKEGTTCIAKSQKALTDEVNAIISAFDKCIEVKAIDTLKENLSELKTKAQEASAEWSKQLESAHINLDSKVKTATDEVNAKKLSVLNYDSTYEKSAECKEKVQQDLESLNFDSLKACSTSQDLESLSSKLDIFVRIESTLSSSEGLCSSAEAKACLEKAVATGRYQIDILNKQLNDLYVSALKTGMQCIEETKEKEHISLSIVLAKFNMCLH